MIGINDKFLVKVTPSRIFALKMICNLQTTIFENAYFSTLNYIESFAVWANFEVSLTKCNISLLWDSKFGITLLVVIQNQGSTRLRIRWMNPYQYQFLYNSSKTWAVPGIFISNPYKICLRIRIIKNNPLSFSWRAVFFTIFIRPVAHLVSISYPYTF